MKNNIFNSIIAIVVMIATVIACGFLRKPKKVQQEKKYEVAPLELDSVAAKELYNKIAPKINWDSIIKSDLEK